MASGQIACPHCGAESSATASLCFNCNGDLRAAPGSSQPSVQAVKYASSTVDYDPSVIRAFAKSMYARAGTITFLYAAAGLVFGAAILSVVGGATGSVESGLILGAILGAGLGYAVGNAKANELRLQAQLALCQAQIEQNTRP